MWGFVTIYLIGAQPNLPRFVAFFLGALILWDILYRSQQGISISFLEEIWSKNLINLFVSPMRPSEFILALMVMSIAKLLVAGLASSFLAWLFYSFNLFTLGFSLIPFVVNLMVMGWSIGIITTGALLLYGQEAEMWAWGLAFFVQPFSAVFYPISVLPSWIQPIALMVPASHIFEGMRVVIEKGTLPIDHLMMAGVFNMIYLALALLFFYRSLRVAKERGLLLHRGTE